jgi:hypothetical protein
MRVALPAALVVVAAACGPLVAHPPYAEQASTALAEVERPPPPARVEVIPARPSRGTVWIDGEWMWHRGRWGWLPGRWVVPPPGAVYAPWAFARGADGKLWYAPGEWREARKGGALVPPPPALATASVHGASVVDAEGDIEPTGAILHEHVAPPASSTPPAPAPPLSSAPAHEPPPP